MTQFAKLFESEKYGQLLLKRDVDDFENPEIRCFAKPEGLGVCTIAVSFSDDDEGHEKADAAFDSAGLDVAESLAAALLEHAPHPTEESAQ